MKQLPFIAHRIREHGIHAYVAWDSQNGHYVKAAGAVVKTWADARQLLGYS